MIPNGQQPIAVIQIALMPNGEMSVNFTGASRAQFNGMMETAKQDMIEKFREAERGPRITAAPAGLRVN